MTEELVPKEKQKPIEEKCLEGKLYYICPYCSTESTLFRNIKDHVNAKHEYCSWYKCTSCDFYSFWTASIQKHLQEKHNCHLNSLEEIDVLGQFPMKVS